MRCEYTVTYEDFIGSVKAYRKVSKRAATSHWLAVWVYPSVGFAVGFCSLWVYTQQRAHPLEYLLLGCLAVGATLGWLGRYRDYLRRGFEQRNVFTKGRSMMLDFDEASTRFIVPDGVEVSYPWRSFSHFHEDDKIAVLFVQEAAFHTIPKAAMGEDGWQQLRQYVEPHVRRND